MDVKAVSDGRQSFKGKVITKGQISTAQNYLFNLHRSVLEQKMKDLPFDLFVEQSKSRKTISLFADVTDASKYIVRKNEQNFEEVAEYAISDGKKKSEAYQKFLKANELLNYKKLIMINIIDGKFKQAREAEKELARLGVESYDVYKDIPQLEFKNLPGIVVKKVIKQSLKYRIYRAFSKKTPDEKEFLRLNKEHYKKLKSEKKEIRKQVFDFNELYWI